MAGGGVGLASGQVAWWGDVGLGSVGHTAHKRPRMMGYQNGLYIYIYATPKVKLPKRKSTRESRVGVITKIRGVSSDGEYFLVDRFKKI